MKDELPTMSYGNIAMILLTEALGIANWWNVMQHLQIRSNRGL
jgi:hypothetical protein